jgi:tyrosyl-tRNA synthetase
MDAVFDVLQDRGFVYQVSDEDGLRRALKSPITLYNGIDATADSLTVGHLMPLMMMTWFQRAGHHPIALMGGGTTLIGDPTGRTSSRPLLSPEEIAGNIESIKKQVDQIFSWTGTSPTLVNNADWLTELGFVEFMRDIGSRFSVNEILRLDAYRTRLEAGGLTFLEFSYVLMQSYDFLRLYEDHGCILQVGGSDQWGNSTAGADLVRRVTGGEAFVLVHPLLLDASGAKMGKTAGNAVWLSAEKMSPYDYFQYWRNTDDSQVESKLAFYTFLPIEEVRRLGSLQGAELNQAKEVLAFEATKIVHGEDVAQEAKETARRVFDSEFRFSGELSTLVTRRLPLAIFEGEGVPVTVLFREAGLVESSNEARAQIQQGGLQVAGERVRDPQARIGLSDLDDENGILLSRGKKRHTRVLASLPS